MKDTYTFPKSYDTNEIISVTIGRIQLASGNIVRIFFTPDGLKIGIRESSLKNGDIYPFASDADQSIIYKD